MLREAAGTGHAARRQLRRDLSPGLSEDPGTPRQVAFGSWERLWEPRSDCSSDIQAVIHEAWDGP